MDDEEEIGKLNQLATDMWADKLAGQQELARLRRLADEMRKVSELVDEADGPQEYQTRLFALALMAREYLRKLDKSATA